MRNFPPDWQTAGARHVWRPYTQMKTAAPPLPVVGAQGVRLHLADGRSLIDGVASWWTAAHGYAHPHLLDAVRTQLARLPHVMLGGLAHEQPYRLAARLSALLPGDLNHVFFAESGSVAVEAAMKMAFQYWLNRNVKGRSKILAFRGGYHGDTIATMSVCDPEEGMHAHFAGLLPQQVIADLPHDDITEAALAALLQQRGPEIAAILVEPLVQGAGGMVLHPPATLQRLRRLADAHDLLLIFDEIFTGFHRTGPMFAMQAAGAIPDIVTLSKALTGGVAPLSAAVASTRVFDAFWSDKAEAALMHGPTYMGHALGCAAANASLDLFAAEDYAARVAAIEAQLRAELEPCRTMAGVRDVRVLGAIGVVELERPMHATAWIARFVELGVWIKPFGRTVYLTPPLVIGEEDLGALTAAVCATTAECAPALI